MRTFVISDDDLTARRARQVLLRAGLDCPTSNVIALDLAIQAKAGEDTPSYVNVPLPLITDENVCEWAADELPDDWYAIPQVPGPAEIEKIIADSLAAEQTGGGTPAASTPVA